MAQKTKKFNELEKELKIHPQTLTRGLRDLQEHRLVVKDNDAYSITAFGSHVIVVAKDLSEKAKNQ